MHIICRNSTDALDVKMTWVMRVIVRNEIEINICILKPSLFVTVLYKVVIYLIGTIGPIVSFA
jgi:hypothetical protein